jgi:hypothetical protein
LIQFFAVQDWKDAGDIIMHHIPEGGFVRNPGSVDILSYALT